MAITVADADQYFNENVLHNEEWTGADEDTKLRALNNAKAQLYRYFRNYNEETKPLPDAAIYEQALWLLRKDDANRKGEQGVMQVTVSGISVLMNRGPAYIAPEVFHIVGRRIGQSV
jgi:hypothetical protein